MATKIIPKKSSVDDRVPLTTDLDVGEIAINLADKKLFTKDGANNIISLGNTEEQRIPIKADVALSKGDVLYATGAVGASGKITVNKYIANNTIDEIYLIGLADRDLAIGEIGYAITFGEIEEIDTTGTAVSETWADGTILYASPTTAGKLTNVQPDAPNQDITTAMVIRAHASTGILFVRPKQGYHLGELHDVYVPSPTDGQVLSWNNTNSRWEAATVEGGGGGATAAYTKSTFTATASQTTFSVSYTVGYVDVYLNGSKLGAADYTASNGTSVVLGTGATVGDLVEIIAWTVTSVDTATSGPVSSTDNALVTFDGTSGKVLQDSGFVMPTTDGTSGQFLQTNGSGTLTFADAGGGGGGLELLAVETVATSVSAVDIDLPAGYSRFRLIVQDLTYAASDSYLFGTISLDGGATFESTNYAYIVDIWSSSAPTSSLTGYPSTGIQIYPNSLNTNPTHSVMDIVNTADQFSLNANTMRINPTTPVAARGKGMGWRQNSSKADVLRLKDFSNNMTGGTFSLYGYKETL
jgi:hypothetical protein